MSRKKNNAKRITTGGNPERFDVVICRYPHRGDTNFVKRVVGLPGECVELREGVLYVDGERQEEPYVSAAYRGGFLSDFGPVTVPDDSFFVLGDHRNVSNDSRRVGAVRRAWITGKVLAVLFPFRLARRIR